MLIIYRHPGELGRTWMFHVPPVRLLRLRVCWHRYSRHGVSLEVFENKDARGDTRRRPHRVRSGAFRGWIEPRDRPFRIPQLID